MKDTIAISDDRVAWTGTLEDMIDQDILDHCSGTPETDGFSLGEKGTAKFWMWDPTQNGYYKLYQQNEQGEIVGIRYVDARLTKVRVWKRTRP